MRAPYLKLLALVKKSHFEGMASALGVGPQNGDAKSGPVFSSHSDGCGRFLIYNRKYERQFSWAVMVHGG